MVKEDGHWLCAHIQLAKRKWGWCTNNQCYSHVLNTTDKPHNKAYPLSQTSLLLSLVIPTLNHSYSCPHAMYPVPQGHERDAKEETDGSAKVGDKRRPRVDQLFPFHKGVVGDRVQAEQEIRALVRCCLSVPFNSILHVMARLETPCLFVDSNQVFIRKFVKEFFIFPIKGSWTVVFVMNQMNGYLLSTTSTCTAGCWCSSPS